MGKMRERDDAMYRLNEAYIQGVEENKKKEKIRKILYKNGSQKSITNNKDKKNNTE